MEHKCSNCGTEMENVGDMKFRVGGFTGIGGMFLGGWNDIMETTQTFTLYRCPQCGKVDFYEPNAGNMDTQGTKKHHLL
ncbi:nucleotide-binding protein [Thermoplasma sp. Kam2015]|uniref:nucleotide-binding protein n=1 Tax=Thermoplasma sp. Kam2015 TaxID=2094122 RepID=UPI000D92F21A|nr:nucleotide-binding protein [Thermoplasma sp. Kam2015]PYB68481.1 nucleotide-binding protein [Thermoplasma sp. Kam2015]